VFQSLRKQEGAQCALGVDLGLHAIKTVLLERVRGGFAVRHAARIPMGANAIHEGVVQERREVASLLRRLVQQTNSRLTSASVAIPTEYMTMRWIDLPRMDADALHTATRFEARKYLSYPVEDADVAIVPVEHVVEREEERLRALLVAAPKKIVRSRAETLEMAGLEVDCAEAEPFALIRALSTQNTSQRMLWSGQPVTYVHLGEELSGICVVQGVQVRFVRAISWGSRRLTEALANAFHCTPEEALAIKEHEEASLDESGLFSWVAEGVRQETDALMEELERLRREIQRLLNYYRSLFPEGSYEGLLDRVVLCGGTAGLKGLAPYFSRLFSIDVVVRNPFHSLASQFSSTSFEAIKHYENSFSVAIGLAAGALQTETTAQAARLPQNREYIWRRKAA
jgi:type IV pilus assembly protein PilM